MLKDLFCALFRFFLKRLPEFNPGKPYREIDSDTFCGDRESIVSMPGVVWDACLIGQQVLQRIYPAIKGRMEVKRLDMPEAGYPIFTISLETQGMGITLEIPEEGVRNLKEFLNSIIGRVSHGIQD